MRRKGTRAPSSAPSPLPPPPSRTMLIYTIITIIALSTGRVQSAPARANSFQVVGNTGVSAQQMFLGVSAATTGRISDGIVY